MNMVAFGDTGLVVSRMGLGLAALGRPGYINLGHSQDLGEDRSVAAMEAHTRTVLDAAWALGIRYFDAARSYGRAEEFLGNWLRTRDVPTDAVTVGSKWGYIYTAGWQVDADVHEVKDHSRDVLLQQWQETGETLGLYLNLYQVHSATFSSGVLTNQAVLDELAQLKAGGVAIGLSLSGPDQADVLRAALNMTVDGVRLFDAVQATWNLLERSAGPALAEAAAAGLGVIVKEALANGRLTPRNGDLAFQDKLALLRQEALRLDTTVDALALAAVTAQPWAHVVLSGAATVEHMYSNAKALDVAWDEAAAATLATLRQSPEEYWAIRSGQPWN